MKPLVSIAAATLPLALLISASVLPQHSLDCSAGETLPPRSPLERTDVAPGTDVKSGTELRILCAGDSITVGYASERDGGDGNGYRLRLRENLSQNKVVFAGTETSDGGNMTDGYFAAWNGKTIQYIEEHAELSLQQRPNIILLHAGTNDMNSNPSFSTEGNDPVAAAQRLGRLIDKMTQECPDAVILVAVIIDTCIADQAPRTKEFQALIPKVVAPRLAAGAHVLAVDFTTFSIGQLVDCVHPTNDGYRLMGDYWYDFITQIPEDWIGAPVGLDPERLKARGWLKQA